MVSVSFRMSSIVSGGMESTTLSRATCILLCRQAFAHQSGSTWPAVSVLHMHPLPSGSRVLMSGAELYAAGIMCITHAGDLQLWGFSI